MSMYRGSRMVHYARRDVLLWSASDIVQTVVESKAVVKVKY